MYSTEYDVQNLVLQLKRVRRRIRALLSSTSQMPSAHATLSSVSSYSAGSALDLASASQQLEAFGKGLSSDMVSLYWAHSRHDAALAVLAKVADAALKSSVRDGLSSLLFRPHWLSLSALEELLPITQRLRALSCYMRPLGAGNEALVEMYVKPLLKGAAGAVGVLFGLQTLIPPTGQNGYTSSSSSSSSSLRAHQKKHEDFVPLSPLIVLQWLRDDVEYSLNHPQFWTLTGWRKHPDEASMSVERSGGGGGGGGGDSNMRSENGRSSRAPLIDLMVSKEAAVGANAPSSSHTMGGGGGGNDAATGDVSSLLTQLLSSERDHVDVVDDDDDVIRGDKDEEGNVVQRTSSETERCDSLSTEIEQFVPPSNGWGRHFMIVFLEGKLRPLYSIVNSLSWSATASASRMSSRHEQDNKGSQQSQSHRQQQDQRRKSLMIMSSLSFSDVLSATAFAEVELRHGVNRMISSSSSSPLDPLHYVESLSWVARPLLQAYLETIDEISSSRCHTAVSTKMVNESSSLVRDFRSRIRLLILFMSLPSFYSAREALVQLRSSPSGQRLLEERSLLLRLMGAHAEAMEMLVHRLGDHSSAETYCRLAVEQSDAVDQQSMQQQSNQGLGGKISEAFTDLLKAYVTSSTSISSSASSSTKIKSSLKGELEEEDVMGTFVRVRPVSACSKNAPFFLD